jgi:hypothetical protein
MKRAASWVFLLILFCLGSISTGYEGNSSAQPLTVQPPTVPQSGFMIRAEGALTYWGPGGVGVASEKHNMVFPLEGGDTVGTMSARSDIIEFNQTLQEYKVAGTGWWTLSYTGSYQGGTSGNAGGYINGGIDGTLRGTPFHITVTGTWDAQVDAALGKMVVDMNLNYQNMPPELSYDTFFTRNLIFNPVPDVKEVGLGADPHVIRISKTGLFKIELFAKAVDSYANALSGRNFIFSVASSFQWSLDNTVTSAWHDGVAYNNLYILIDDLSKIPDSITVSVT